MKEEGFSRGGNCHFCSTYYSLFLYVLFEYVSTSSFISP